MRMFGIAVVAGAMAMIAGGCGLVSPAPSDVPVTKPTHVATMPVVTQPAPLEPAPATQPRPVEPRPAEPAKPVEPKPAEPVKPDPGLSTALPAGPAVGPAGPPIAPSPDTQPATAPARPAEVAHPVAPARPIEPARSAGELVSVSALQVNDKFVSVHDVLRLAHRELSELPKNISEATFRARAAEIVQDHIRSRITQLLVLREAQKRITEDKTREIDQELENLRKEWVADIGQGSVQKLDAVLRTEGTSLKELMDEERNRLIAQAYLREKFLASIFVNHRMLTDHFRRHQAEFSSDKQVQMQIIAAPVAAFLETKYAGDPSREEVARARAKARQTIDQALAALKAGQDFGQTATKFSKGLKAEQGGLWPMMSAGSFKETRVEEAAFAMEKGQVSDVLETTAGFFIVKVADVKPGKVARFEDVQEQIESTLRQQQYRKLTEAYLQEMIKHATIVHSEEFTQLTIDRAVARHYRPAPALPGGK